MNPTPDTPRILVASQNPVKANAIQLAFVDMFGITPKIERYAVSSGVSDQPSSDAETLTGATNRVSGAVEHDPTCDFFAGIEGGIEEHGTGMLAFAWIFIRSGDLVGQARTATFPLPLGIAQLVRDGIELGKANDMVFGVENSKHGNGAVGLLTAGVIDRESLYRHAACLAFIPFRNAELLGPREVE